MKASAYAFAADVDQRIAALTSPEYHERPRNAKRLIEEIYPMSRLGLALHGVGLHVQIEAHENSDRADGHIWISG